MIHFQINFCPSGSAMNVRYKKCSFNDLSYECLGSWKGSDNQNYLALIDSGDSHDPKYRCAVSILKLTLKSN